MINDEHWFRRTRLQIIRDLRTLEAIQTAQSQFTRLVSGGDALDHEIAKALHTSYVVSYCRPFSSNKAEDGAKWNYPVSRISDAPGFSRPIHDHLLALRNTMTAHCDEDALDGRLWIQTAIYTTEHDRFFCNVSGAVVSHSLIKISDDIVASDVKAHLEAVRVKVSSVLTEDFTQLIKASNESPAEFERGMDRSGPEISFDPGTGVQTQHSVPRIPPHPELLRTPNLGTLGVQYRYQQNEFNVVATGRMRAVSESGTEYFVEVTPNK